MIEKVRDSFIQLAEYCKREAFKGYDPYDGLNSNLFQVIPFIRDNRLARLAWIQLFKRLPINLRPIVGIRKDYNPKALGLFLSGYCNLYKKTPNREYLDMIHSFSDKLLETMNTKYSGACWGYNFDWQAKAFYQPRNTPTVVVTAYVGSALLDAYEITEADQFLQTVRSTCDFINRNLNRSYDNKGNFAFSYSPLDKTVVFNASLLGSRLLSRVFSFTHEKELLDNARKSVAYCCGSQNKDGSWRYGTLNIHKWIDNFHTGFNLESIADYMKFSGDYSFKNQLNNGFDFYIKTFFTKDGISKYYNNSIYPIDIHAPAQLIITLIKLGRFQEYWNLAEKVLFWTIENMQSKEGFFFYQKNKYFTSKIPYMRWAQSWMFYAMSEYLLQANCE
jgi:rhamnogalacturonyl hydrolase YesR